MVDSILNSTKASLGLAADHTAFDAEIIMHINSVLSDLQQLGVGPEDGLAIEDSVTEWTALTTGQNKLNSVKSYTHLRVKLLFDPPDIGFVLTAMKEQIEKAEWRLMIAVDPPREVPIDEIPDLVFDGGDV